LSLVDKFMMMILTALQPWTLERKEKRRSKDLLLKSRAAGPAASWACPWSICICTSCFLMCNCLSLFGAWLACAMISHADRKHCTKAFSFLFLDMWETS
jgi:hypothetical protein